jgi:hypothetical protein
MDGSTAIDSATAIDSTSVMDAGRRDGNSTAIDGLMAGTAMDDATATQRRWTVVVDNGRQLTA